MVLLVLTWKVRFSSMPLKGITNLKNKAIGEVKEEVLVLGLKEKEEMQQNSKEEKLLLSLSHNKTGEDLS